MRANCLGFLCTLKSYILTIKVIPVCVALETVQHHSSCGFLFALDYIVSKEETLNVLYYVREIPDKESEP